MKNTLYSLFILLGACLFAGCGSSDDNGSSALSKQLAGEWHLVSWNAEKPAEFDAYISFGADGRFDIYQQIEQVDYQKYGGTYLLKNTALSGVYDDRTTWGSTYEMSFDESGNTLTLVSESEIGEVGVYTRTPIPESIKSDATVVTPSRSIFRRLL